MTKKKTKGKGKKKTICSSNTKEEEKKPIWRNTIAIHSTL
jgi:hypothetical protein